MSSWLLARAVLIPRRRPEPQHYAGWLHGVLHRLPQLVAQAG
jgi:hypothetical protein